MRRWCFLALVLCGSGALAAGIDGWGRISIGGGFRWVPNWWFVEHAAAAGTPVVPGLSGGPQLTASFGYGVSSLFELSVDVLGGYENITLRGPDDTRDEYTSVSTGVLLGGRLVGTDVIFKGLMPYLSLQTGPLLSSITSRSSPIPEKLMLSFSASGGLTYRFADHYGLTLEARYLYGRNVLPPISGINVGGVLFSAMFTIFFPPPPKRDLDVPGF